MTWKNMDGEPAKSMWIVCLPCGKRFPMVGSPKTHDEALAIAVKIWPEAKVE